MDYLVKINQKKRYIRITIPNKIAQAVGLKEYPFAKIRRTRNNKIEVEGVGIKEKEEK